MKFKKYKCFLNQLGIKFNYGSFKGIFFISSLSYFCFYFFNNLGQISFNIDLVKNGNSLLLSFLFCILSVFFNAYAWKNIVLWFGKINDKRNLVSFYVLTNILKYVPGGIWHFVERFNLIKNISNTKLALYSTLIEPYFMLCAAFLLASTGIIFSPLMIFILIPLGFLNRKLIYIVLMKLESLKSKAYDALKLGNSDYQVKQKINLTSFFPTKAFLYETGFLITKFVGFLICFNTIYQGKNINIIFLLVIFSVSWSIGLIVPASPSGVGVFEAAFIFLINKNLPQNIIIVSLIYFRVISTSADLFLSLPFLCKRFLKKI